MNQVSLSTPKLSKNQSTSMLPDCLSRSPTVPPIHLGSTKSDNFKTSFSLPVFQTTKNDPFSNDFCRIYFWTSLSSIPVLACIVSVTLYLCVIRKSHKAIQNGNASTKKRSDVNVKSTCYANDGENEYHEVQYCLAQYTEN
ncbi:uncharacterized protein LOC134234081 [Saccostrea cucullata]|uniref:uncharacterized protein LOC134234081 n=1 Tax=Saccostrea cuccullata TaxID=36930 RepID=UPI002ED1E01B